MKIFVIIITYNGMQWYDCCLESLRRSEIPVSIIVVDNASSDGTIEYLKEKYPEIILFENGNNLGFGKANNVAIKYALEHNCDYVFLLNQDAWIELNTISELVRIHQNNKEYGILSPMHLNAEKNSIESGLIHYIDDYKVTDGELLNDLYFNRLKDIYCTNYVNAAAWLLPRNTIEKIGGFDPIFLHYGEDDNYLQRVLYHGLKVAICPNCRVVHDTRQSEQSNKIRTNNCCRLTCYTDINKSYSLFKYSRYYIRKLLVHFFSGRIDLIKEDALQTVYLWKMNKFVRESRNENRKIGRNYL